MNAYAFFRLYWRPGMLVVLFFSLPPWVGVYVALTKIDSLTKVDPAYFPDPANALLVLVSFVGASLVGTATLEVYASPFSWTLPNLRRHFSRMALIVGLVFAASASWFQQWTGGTLSPLPAFALAACCYALTIYYHHHVTKGHELLMLAAGLVLVDPVAGLGTSYPLPFSALALGCAGWLLYRVYALKALRTVKAGSCQTMFHPATYARMGSEDLGRSADSRSRVNWPRTHLGASLWRWSRAGEYERTGHSRLGIFTLPLIGIGVMFFMPAFVVYIHSTVDDLPLLAALNNLWGLFIALDLSIERDFKVAVATTWKFSSGFVFFFGAAGYAFQFNSLGSHLEDRYPKFLYPLARRQQARITFSTILGKGALYTLTVTATYYAVVLLGAAALDREINYVLPVAYPVALLLIIAPLLQWPGLHFWPRIMAAPSRAPFQVIGIGLAFASSFGVAVLSVYWMKMSPLWPGWPQAAAALAAAVLAHYLYYRKLQQHYERHDLVR